MVSKTTISLKGAWSILFRMTGEQRNQLPYRIALTAVEEENETQPRRMLMSRHWLDFRGESVRFHDLLISGLVIEGALS
jgi:hypothetical protein